jgi:hypothetical protein
MFKKNEKNENKMVRADNLEITKYYIVDGVPKMLLNKDEPKFYNNGQMASISLRFDDKNTEPGEKHPLVSVNVEDMYEEVKDPTKYSPNLTKSSSVNPTKSSSVNPTTNPEYLLLLEEVNKILIKNQERNEISDEIERIEKEILNLENTAKPMMADGFHTYNYWNPIGIKIKELDIKQKELIKKNINSKNKTVLDTEKKKLIECKEFIKNKIIELESEKTVQEIKQPTITQKTFTFFTSKANNTTIEKNKTINNLTIEIANFKELLKTIEKQLVLYPDTTTGGKNKTAKKQKNKKTKKQKKRRTQKRL